MLQNDKWYKGIEEKMIFWKFYSGGQQIWETFFVPIEGQNDPKSIRTVSRWHDPILGLLWVHILPILDLLVIWKEKKLTQKRPKKYFFSIFGPWRAQKYTFTPKIIYYQKLEVQTLLLREKKGKNFGGSFEILCFLSKMLSERSECSQSTLGSKTAFYYYYYY